MKYPEARELQEIEKHWFKDHVATFSECGATGLKLMEWKAPKTWCYAIRYILDGGTLCVWGDLGEAVYRWNGGASFEFIAGTDLGYFKSKCEASEKGRGSDFYDFSFEEFAKNLRTEIGENPESYRDVDLESLEYCEPDEYGVISWLRDQPIDGETAGHFLSGGKTINLRCAAHWMGIKMAVAQLASVSSKTESKI
jgi:hypothetical protein